MAYLVFFACKKTLNQNYDHNYWTQFKPDDQYFETVTQF